MKKKQINIYVVINHKVGIVLTDTASNYKKDAITKSLGKSNKQRIRAWAYLRRQGFSCEKFVCQNWSIKP